MPVAHQHKSRESYPPLSTAMLPPGYQWQDEVLSQEKGAADQYQTSAPLVDMPVIQIGRTLVFGMVKPSDWDALDEPTKWRKKREYLCERYGHLCFTFLEDSDATRNPLGRIIVAPKDYYALFEVWSCAKVETQYRASMVLLEEGLRMGLDSFLELKRMLGVCWTKPIKSSMKRPFIEDTSQAPLPDLKGEVDPRSKAKRVRIQEPTPVPEPQQGPKPKPAPFENIALQDQPQISRLLFPAAYMASNAFKSTARNPCTLRTFTTIRRTKFAKRLQLLHQPPKVKVDRLRLCRQYGQGRMDANQAEGKHREQIIFRFEIVIQYCTMLGASLDLDVDQVIQLLAVDASCGGHPDLTSVEFLGANVTLKWAFLYAAYLKTCINWKKAKIGAADWATKWDVDVSAKIELFQYMQERSWLLFNRAATLWYQKHMTIAIL